MISKDLDPPAQVSEKRSRVVPADYTAVAGLDDLGCRICLLASGLPVEAVTGVSSAEEATDTLIAAGVPHCDDTESAEDLLCR
jgi:hypothetical protein